MFWSVIEFLLLFISKFADMFCSKWEKWKKRLTALIKELPSFSPLPKRSIGYNLSFSLYSDTVTAYALSPSTQAIRKVMTISHSNIICWETNFIFLIRVQISMFSIAGSKCQQMAAQK